MQNSKTSETIRLQRGCIATRVPYGDQVVLPEGAEVTITQSLGGSFTINMRGNLYRIAGNDADALGEEQQFPPTLENVNSAEEFDAIVYQQLKTVYDPEIPIDILELGLVYDCNIIQQNNKRYIELKMTLTSPGCGMGSIIADEVKSRLEIIPTVEKANVEVVFNPPWSKEMMSETAKLEMGLL